MTKRNKPVAVADSDGHLWTRAVALGDRQTIIDGISRHRDGYMMADARVARVGTQTYRGYEVGLPEKDRVTLYRPEEEVFSRDSMHSMANKPVTLLHPKQMVDAKSWSKVAKGMSGGDVVRDGDYVRVPLMLTDAKTIDAFERGEARELSVGYLCDIDWLEGTTPDGKHFDGVQRSIRANHHALVPVARGGANLRLGDAKLACKDCSAPINDDDETCPGCGADLSEMLPEQWQTDAAPGGNDRRESMAVTKLFDGVPVNFVDESSAAIVTKEFSRFQRVIDEMTAEAKKKASDDDADDKDFKEKMAAKDAALGAKEGEIAVLKKQLVDAQAQTSEAVLDARQAARALVLDSAAPHLPRDYQVAGKSVAEIRRAAVAQALGDSTITGWADAMVEGAFATLVASKSGTRAMADGLSNGMRSTAHQHQFTDAEKRVNDSHAAYVKGLEDAWKAPIAGAH